MSNELEKRFSSYLKKNLKGFSMRQKDKISYSKISEAELKDRDVNKLTYKDYVENQQNSFSDLDVDFNHVENAFSNPLYYQAMKKVPLLQKQVLYLLVVDDLTVNEISNLLNIKPKKVYELKQLAINNFKKNLGELK